MDSGQALLLPAESLLLCLAMMLGVLLMSYTLSLGLESSLFIGSLRTIGQLSILGYLLLPIFSFAEANPLPGFFFSPTFLDLIVFFSSGPLLADGVASGQGRFLETAGKSAQTMYSNE
jgi:hypothetical protein